MSLRKQLVDVQKRLAQAQKLLKVAILSHSSWTRCSVSKVLRDHSVVPLPRHCRRASGTMLRLPTSAAQALKLSASAMLQLADPDGYFSPGSAAARAATQRAAQQAALEAQRAEAREKQRLARLVGGQPACFTTIIRCECNVSPLKRVVKEPPSGLGSVLRGQERGQGL